MSLTDLLIQARTRKAEEFLFVVGSEPRARLSSGWASLRSSPGLVTEWNLLQQSLLSSHQQAVLDATGIVQGETAIESLRIGFSFFQQDNTMKALLDMDLDGKRQEMMLPQILLETCQRMKGLVLLSGPGDAGQTSAIYNVLQKMADERSFLGVVFSKKPFPQMKEGKACLLYHTGDFTKASEKENLLSGANVIVYDGFSDDESFFEALSYAEQGYFVIYGMKASSVMSVLRRALSTLVEKYGEYGAPRFAEALSIVAGLYPVSGLSSEKVYAHEVLMMKPQVRSLIENENMKELENLMATSAENSGILTLNQSLLQHMIRRRIDMKTAFESSRDPDSLDQLLKKVGI